MHPTQLSIADFTYNLPPHKIAFYPLAERDQSKLLLYGRGKIKEDIYKNIASYIPENSLLIFNDSKVIPARIQFSIIPGSVIELFCLEPFGKINDYAVAMNERSSVRWKCMIGGADKWKSSQLEKSINIGGITVKLIAEVKEKITGAYIIGFSWQPAHFTFATILEGAGDVPLPPYIKRSATKEDKERYQTIYALQEGSVAVPTAGLHFSPAIFSSVERKGITKDFITLHVGAGTFKPVKSATLADHEMHAEYMEISIGTFRNILQNAGKNLVAVGTTSLRALESVYWMGVKELLQPDRDEEYLSIKQWEVYDPPLAQQLIDIKTALHSLIMRMEKHGKEKLFIKTQIMIVPGYKFRIVNALITNFHQPGSTLLLLIAAAAGNHWKEIYAYALENDFRFLSYGDGCFITLERLE